MDPAEFIRATVGEPLAEPLPWQEAIYRGEFRRVTVGGGRALRRRALMTLVIAEALLSGETVNVQAATQEEADKLMAEGRRLLEAKG
jgi:hypothetical protein